MGMAIRVEERKLDDIAQALGDAYTKLSSIHTALEDDHAAIKAAWEDDAAFDFSTKFDNGMERLWDLMIAVDNMEQFLITAREMYAAAENKVLSL